MRIVWEGHPEHNEGQFQHIHRSSEFRKHPRSTAAAQQRLLQQRYNTGEPRNAHLYKGTPAFPLFNLRHPPHVKSTTSRRGTLYIYDTEHVSWVGSVLYISYTYPIHIDLAQHITTAG